jgi:hypothetical protein
MAILGSFKFFICGQMGPIPYLLELILLIIHSLTTCPSSYLSFYPSSSFSFPDSYHSIHYDSTNVQPTSLTLLMLLTLSLRYFTALMG